MDTMTAPALASLHAPVPVDLRVVGDGRRSTNRVLAAKRRVKAVELVASGMTYEAAAKALGYKNRGTVHKIVHSALHAEQADSVEQLRQLEVSRLDAMQAGLWSRAEAGDIEAVQQCVRIIESRIRLLGLVPVSSSKRRKCRQPQTVILQEDDCRKRGCSDHS